MFKIGQKVVCKDNSGCPELTINKIYTIYAIDRCPYCKIIGLELEEVGEGDGSKLGECICGKIFETDGDKEGFKSTRFEPLKYDLLDNKDIISELIKERADIKVPELIEN